MSNSEFDRVDTSPPARRRSHRFSVWAGLMIGSASTIVGFVVLAFGLMGNAFVPNEAAFWLAIAAISFGLTAVATR